MTQTVKQKVQAKAQRIRRYENGKTQYIQNKMFKETKQLYRNLGTMNTEARELPIDGRSRALLEVTVGRKSIA